MCCILAIGGGRHADPCHWGNEQGRASATSSLGCSTIRDFQMRAYARFAIIACVVKRTGSRSYEVPIRRSGNSYWGAFQCHLLVVHRTCKETYADVADVTVKGLFWLLEDFRTGYCAAIHPPSAATPVSTGHSPPPRGAHDRSHAAPGYRGCYALSKVLEEVMLEQFGIQYGLNASCLRAPWIMERMTSGHAFIPRQTSSVRPDWKTLVPPGRCGRFQQRARRGFYAFCRPELGNR